MSKISNFNDQPIEVKDGDVTLKVYPILAKKSHLFNELSDNNSEMRLKGVNSLIKESLRDEKVTDEELENMTTRVQNLMMDAIIKVNGYEDKVEDARKKFVTGQSKQASK